MQYRTAPARVHAVVECPNCGSFRKAEAEMMIAHGSGSPDRVHCHFQCERCGSYKAILHLECEVLPRH